MILDEERCDAFASHLAAHPEIMEEIPIKAIRITGSGFSSLSHRDFMGGILSLGIERSVVGDIAVISESEAIVFVLDKIAPYIDAELTKIGRDRVKTEIFTPSPEFVIPRKFENMAIVVSSPRIDGIVKAITGKSREASADMVRAGLVELSYESVDDVSTQVHAGDILTVRGYGKYVIGDIVGETKSGRIRLTCKKYL
jgi:RNA-binding protein YlmH